MFDIFDLLTITWRFFQTFPVLSGLGDIVTNFLGRQTKWTNFGSQGRSSCYSPPTAFNTTTLISLGSNLGGILNRCFRFYKLWRKKNTLILRLSGG